MLFVAEPLALRVMVVRPANALESELRKREGNWREIVASLRPNVTTGLIAMLGFRVLANLKSNIWGEGWHSRTMAFAVRIPRTGIDFFSEIPGRSGR